MSARRMRGSVLALIGCAALLGACQDLFVEPAAPDTAALAILLHATSSARGGQSDAFDRAERARIRITRSSGAVLFDETVALPPPGEERVVDVEVEIEGDAETLQLETQLLWSGSVLFQGGTAVSLERGGTTNVNVVLSPVAAGIQVPVPSGPITTIGGTLQLVGTVVYASGDAIGDATVAWNSLDPEIATVSPLGLVTARAEGTARIVASGMGQQTTVNVTVLLAVASVDVSPLAMELAVGAVRQATATPRDAAGTVLNRPVAWQTSAPGVATVDGSGLVRGVAAGTATITASAGGVTSAGIAVVVSDIPVASVTVTPPTTTLTVAQTAQLTATLRDGAGNVLSGRTVTWSSGNAAVATVSGSGLVTAHAGGQATITATSEGRSGTAQITVQAPVIQLSSNLVSLVTTTGTNPTPRIIGIGNAGTGTLSGLSSSIAYGGTAQGWLGAQLSGTTAPATVTLAFDVSSLAEGNYSAVVTIASSLAGVAPATIRVELAVRQVPVARVTVTPPTSTLLIGQTVQLTATLRDANGNVLTGRTTAWSSSNGAAATVDANGLVTAVAGGQATITATSEGQSGTAAVSVVAPAIVVNPPNVSVGTTVGRDPAPVNVSVTNGGTGTLGGLSTSITYGSGQGWLAAQLSGTTAPTTLALTFSAASLAQGNYSATVTVSSSLQGVAPVQITVNLAVQQAPVAVVEVRPTQATLQPTQTVQLAVTLRDSMNNVLTGRVVTWTTSDAAVATVNPAGLVTAIGPGTATITATSEGVPGPASITVVQPSIVLTPTSVTFQTNVGQDPQPQNVAISNGGGGTLSGLSTSTTYAAGGPQGWLNVSLTQQPNAGAMTISAFVANTQLPAGTYTATVTVSSSLPGVQAVQLPVTLNVRTPQFVIRIGGSGKGRGTIAGPGIDCTIDNGVSSGACIAQFAAGTQVTLTATPAQGSYLFGWGDACAQYGSNAQCFVNVDADLAVSAQFEILANVAPAISNLTVQLLAVNDSTSCSHQTPNGSLFRTTFRYSDANGNVTNPTVTENYVFGPGGQSGTWNPGFTRSGDGFSGTITYLSCTLFSGQSTITRTITLDDDAGARSNSLQTIDSRPVNGNGGMLETNAGGAAVSAPSQGSASVSPNGRATGPSQDPRTR